MKFQAEKYKMSPENLGTLKSKEAIKVHHGHVKGHGVGFKRFLGTRIKQERVRELEGEKKDGLRYIKCFNQKL